MRSLLLRLILQLLLLPILPTVYALSTAALRKHYASLGVSPKAGAGEIKRAYKKLAMKWHPDKNPSNKAAAEKKFKEINAAYQILNDPVKRKEYDQYGEDSNKYSIPRGMDSSQFSFKFGNFGGRSQGSPDTSFMADDILGSMFQNIFRGPMGFQKSRYQPERRSDINTRSVEKTLSISLEEAFRGCKKKFRMKDVVLGRSIQRDIVIDVKPGWKTGTIVKFPAINTFPVAVKFKVSVQKHPFLERIGDDLRWTCKLTKAQFENGVVIKVPMIDGTVIEQSTRELESSAVNGTTKIYENRGMPISSGMTHHYFEEKRGNFILLFEIVP